MRLNNFITEGSNNLKTAYMVLDQIWKDCQPFLKDIYDGNKTQFMYSGRNNRNDHHFIGTVRKNRRPLNTSFEIQNDLDEIFYKEFGVRPRSNSVFCTGNDYDASEYGTSFIIFPIGQYKFVWSNKIDDLFVYVSNNSYSRWSKRTNGLKNRAAVEVIKDKNPEVIKLYNKEFLKRPDITSMTVLQMSMEEGGPYGDGYNWVSKTKNKYIRDLVNKKYKEILNNMVSQYQSTDIKRAIKRETEIMVICDKYHALLEDLYSQLVYDMIILYGLTLPSYEEVKDYVSKNRGLYGSFEI